MNNAERAEQFGNRIRLTPFLVIDPDIKSIYGYSSPALNLKKLQACYEKNEPNAAWRDWPAFLNTVQHRFDNRAFF